MKNINTVRPVDLSKQLAKLLSEQRRLNLKNLLVILQRFTNCGIQLFSRDLVYDGYHRGEDKGSVNVFMATCPFFLFLMICRFWHITYVLVTHTPSCSK